MTITVQQRERLQLLRKQADLSKLALSKLIGVSHTHVSHVESGKSGISASLARKWVVACGGTGLAELYGEDRRVEVARSIGSMDDLLFHAVATCSTVGAELGPEDLNTLIVIIEAVGARAGVEVERLPTPDAAAEQQ